MSLRSLFSADTRPPILLTLAWLTTLSLVAAGTILSWHQGPFWPPLILTCGALGTLALALGQGLQRHNQLLEKTRAALRQETDRRVSAVADLERIASNRPADRPRQSALLHGGPGLRGPARTPVR